jgi:uncharacterized protein (TIGR02001 family)
MRNIVRATAVLAASCAAAQAAPVDTTSMPQLTVPDVSAKDTAAPVPQFAFSLTGASDYIFRGVSQTENGPAIFGSARVTTDEFYAGVGAENVNFHSSINAEYDLSAGWAPKIVGFSLDLGAIRYGYMNENAHTHIDTVEFKGIVSHDLGPITLGAAVFYTPNYFGTGRDGTYFEGRTSYKITDSLSASAALGRQTISAGGDYSTWNAGLGYAVTKTIGIDVHYYDTDEHKMGKTHGSHLVGAIKASF